MSMGIESGSALGRISASRTAYSRSARWIIAGGKYLDKQRPVTATFGDLAQAYLELCERT